MKLSKIFSLRFGNRTFEQKGTIRLRNFGGELQLPDLRLRPGSGGIQATIRTGSQWVIVPLQYPPSVPSPSPSSPP